MSGSLRLGNGCNVLVNSTSTSQPQALSCSRVRNYIYAGFLKLRLKRALTSEGLWFELYLLALIGLDSTVLELGQIGFICTCRTSWLLWLISTKWLSSVIYHLCIHPCIHLSIYLSTYLSIYPSICAYYIVSIWIGLVPAASMHVCLLMSSKCQTIRNLNVSFSFSADFDSVLKCVSRAYAIDDFPRIDVKTTQKSSSQPYLDTPNSLNDSETQIHPQIRNSRINIGALIIGIGSWGILY